MHTLNEREHDMNQLYFRKDGNIAVARRVTDELYEQARTFCRGFVAQRHSVSVADDTSDAGMGHEWHYERDYADVLEPEDVLMELVAGEPAAGEPAAGEPDAGVPSTGEPAAEGPATEGPAAEEPVCAGQALPVGFVFGIDRYNGRFQMLANPADPSTWKGTVQGDNNTVRYYDYTDIAVQRPVSVSAMRAADAACIAAGTPSHELMQRAGAGIYDAANLLCFNLQDNDCFFPTVSYWKAPVCILCGTGNNAGDGYVVAKMLAEHCVPVTIVLAKERFSADGKYYFDQCAAAGIPAVVWREGMSLNEYGTIVDCLLGTGFAGDVREPFASMIAAANEAHRAGAIVVSADINSGLSGDTGLGTTFVESDLTVSIGVFKTGHFAGLADVAMQCRTNVDIGIPVNA